jgi:hypothetical protein
MQPSPGWSHWAISCCTDPTSPPVCPLRSAPTPPTATSSWNAASATPSLVERNRAVHRMLVDGITVEYRRPHGSIVVVQARIGALGAGKEWFKPWRTITGREDAPVRPPRPLIGSAGCVGDRSRLGASSPPR